ncbi:ABC transporter ATP-binding protein [Pseudogracilibacillus sp. SE30717A]|uniref:ABC transporter ATP-binding protein n=1 Tax=Pseudogracilibacillus sp. SE30717A TaxID=3098293 RepID=UPI00300E3C77
MQIEVKNVTKKYQTKYALENVSFSLHEPKIYGLLGRNGAGKTTFMEILAGHQLATDGEVLVNGKSPFDNREVVKEICLIKEADNFNKDMRIHQIIKACSLLYPKWDQQLADELLKEYKLNGKARVKTLSKGMSSALGVIVGLASKAAITIFDEPYIGMDAAARRKFYDILLEEYEEEKRTIIFSTHLIDEVSLLFEEVLILQEGKLILQETADTLRDKTCAVTGEIEEVKKFICNKKVMKTKQLANVMTAYIYGDREEANQSNLQVEGIPIQDLMIYLTETERGA